MARFAGAASSSYFFALCPSILSLYCASPGVHPWIAPPPGHVGRKTAIRYLVIVLGLLALTLAVRGGLPKERFENGLAVRFKRYACSGLLVSVFVASGCFFALPYVRIFASQLFSDPFPWSSWDLVNELSGSGLRSYFCRGPIFASFWFFNSALGKRQFPQGVN